MKKRFNFKFKKIISLTLCLMLCFCCAFVTTGCFVTGNGNIDPGTGSGSSGSGGSGNSGSGGSGSGAGSGTGSEDIGGSGTTTQKYKLTIDANGGAYKGFATYEVAGTEGTIYLIETPTPGDETDTFAGWVLVDGVGLFNGSQFTFGKGDATIKATWESSVVGLDPTNYLTGGRFTYKPNPNELKGSNHVEKVKEQLDLMGKDVWARLVNWYLDGSGSKIVEDYYKINSLPLDEIKTIYENEEDKLLNNVLDWKILDTFNLTDITSDKLRANYKYHLQFLYVGVITGQYEKQDDSSYKILNVNDLDYAGDLQKLITANPAEMENIYNSFIDNYAIYIDHTGLLEFEQEILADLILTDIIGANLVTADSNKFANNDGVEGFGSEMYFNTLYTVYDENNLDFTDVEDKDSDGEIESGEFTATEDYVSFDELYGIMDVFGTEVYFPKFIDEDGDNKFDVWTKETFIAKGYCTEKTYNPDIHYYHLYKDGTELKYEFSDGKNTSITSVGTIYNNCFVPKEGYEFDIRRQGFKNYENIVASITSAIANATYKDSNNNEVQVYPCIPALYIQDLDCSEMTMDMSGSLEDASFFDNKILSNTNTAFSLQSVIFNVKQAMNLKSMDLFFEFIDKEALSFMLNLQVRYYHNGEMFEFDIGDFTIKQGDVNELGFDNIPGISIDFTSIAAKMGFKTEGLVVNEYDSILNNHSTIKPDLNSLHRTSIATDLDNFDKCFKVEEKNKTASTVYSDTSSDFFELVFNAEKINGVTPNYKLCFFMMDIAKVQ